MLESLSKNLTMKEIIATNTGLENIPESQAIEYKLFVMANVLFQPVREIFGKIICSGYRSPEVNKAVNGKYDSQHLLAEAIDMVPKEADIDVVFKWIVKHMRFGQAILEKDGDKQWIHLSMLRETKENQDALIFDGQWYRKYSV